MSKPVCNIHLKIIFTYQSEVTGNVERECFHHTIAVLGFELIMAVGYICQTIYSITILSCEKCGNIYLLCILCRSTDNTDDNEQNNYKPWLQIDVYMRIFTFLMVFCAIWRTEICILCKLGKFYRKCHFLNVCIEVADLENISSNT